MRSESDADFRPPATVLKPLCGRDFGLIENLRSFCVQDYPTYQIVFGVRSAHDPAAAVVERLIREYPDRDLSLVVDAQLAGTNFKISNLVNMYGAAKHALLVVADSDMRVKPDYIASVVGPFWDARVGAVTCLYRGRSSGNFSSSLASMFINEWFLPSVLVSTLMRDVSFCLGATMVIRREVLDEIGGFGSLANFLADDYMLGKRVRDLGYRVELSSYVVENVVHERSLRSMFEHELRWARTIRTLRPAGYRFSFVMNSITVAAIGWVLGDLTFDIDPIDNVVPVVALGLRVGLHYAVGAAFDIRGSAPVWMIPIRDVFSFVIWLSSYFGRTVMWQNAPFIVEPDGRMIANEGMRAP